MSTIEELLADLTGRVRLGKQLVDEWRERAEKAEADSKYWHDEWRRADSGEAKWRKPLTMPPPEPKARTWTLHVWQGGPVVECRCPEGNRVSEAVHRTAIETAPLKVALGDLEATAKVAIASLETHVRFSDANNLASAVARLKAMVGE